MKFIEEGGECYSMNIEHQTGFDLTVGNRRCTLRARQNEDELLYVKKKAMDAVVAKIHRTQSLFHRNNGYQDRHRAH